MNFTQSVFDEIVLKWSDKKFTQMDLRYMSEQANRRRKNITPFLEALERRGLIVKVGEVPHPHKNIGHLQTVYELVPGASYTIKNGSDYRRDLTNKQLKMMKASKKVQEFTLHLGGHDVI